MRYTRSVDSLQKALEALGRLGPALDAVGKNQQANVTARILFTKMAPDGKPWAPWARSTAKARMKKGNAGQGLLNDSGELSRSIRYQVSGKQVIVGSIAGPYAEFLQFGTNKMPARPFIGWSEQDKKEAKQIMMDHLKREIKK